MENSFKALWMNLLGGLGFAVAILYSVTELGIINLQDLVNGLDWIEANIKGKVCIDLDIDRQRITPFGTPQQVRDLVKEEISRLGTRDGGLMLTYGWYPGVPLENIKALMDALEENMYYV